MATAAAEEKIDRDVPTRPEPGHIADEVWEETRSLRPIIEGLQHETDVRRRLPKPIADAFLERDVYRLILPRDYGGRELDPLATFDLTEEVAYYDGSVGWNYSIGSNSGMMAGVLSPETVATVFTGPDSVVVGSGPPQGKAVAVEGGYRVTGKFAWASGIHQAKWVSGGCFVYDGEEMRKGPSGGPVVVHAVAPREDATLLDTWKTGGMRGTGSTEFVLDDVFVPENLAVNIFGTEPTHPAPIYRLPTSFFGFGLTAVPLGIARRAIDGLKELAINKKPPPPRAGLAEQPYTQYVVGKGEAMIEAARFNVREAFRGMWKQVLVGEADMESRARLRRASVHAVETSVEAVSMAYRAAGGTALFEDQPFERALRDVNATAGHIVFQRAMMEDCGRVAMGLPPLLAMF